MLALEDCIGLCGLTEDEVLAIAEHERIPEIAAAEIANYLVQLPDGDLCIKAMIEEDIAAAVARADGYQVLALKLVLRNFILEHPHCEERHRVALHVPERRGTLL